MELSPFSSNQFAPQIEVIAYHGWGFAAAVWQNWQVLLTQQGHRFQAFDRGYFGSAMQPSFSPSARLRVILAHSYGLHLCPAAQLAEADALVLFGSFQQFHPQSDRVRKRSQQMLQQMIAQFELNPQRVLQNFRAKCYQPDLEPEPAPTALNRERLLHDLIELDTAELDLSLLQAIPQVVIMHGAADRIVAPTQAKALAEQLPEVQYWEFPEAGHALPFTHTEACWLHLQPLLADRTGPHHSAPAPSPNCLKAKIAHSFGQAATAYDAHAQLQWNCAKHLLEMIAESCADLPTGRILEIGCGTGAITQGLLPLFPQRSLEITDLSAAMLKFCQSRLVVPDQQLISFYQLDGEQLHAHQTQAAPVYAAIVAGFVIQWFQDPVQSILNWIEQLTPQGILFISFPTCHSFPEWQTLCQQLDLPFTANALPDSDALSQSLPDNVRPLVSEIVDLMTTHANAMEFFRGLKTIGAGVNQTQRRLSPKQMRQLLQAWNTATPVNEICVHYQVAFWAIQRQF